MLVVSKKEQVKGKDEQRRARKKQGQVARKTKETTNTRGVGKTKRKKTGAVMCRVIGVVLVWWEDKDCVGKK